MKQAIKSNADILLIITTISLFVMLLIDKAK